ncbi:lysophospholipid acyltransferase family protein [Peribacillus acanthi]|uniref:lysophospholipid acyltransferase family protein n=1 Tax=Peribacillus acanthi TaxID=2171554 RepID=UPI000D3E4A4E|nr:lysophospholipid acyltransferase family protein [Peribacillus acanthi]
MFRTGAFFAYFFGFLLYSIPHLRQVKGLEETSVSVEEKDKKINVFPKKWANTLIRIAGCNVKVLGEENIPNGPILIVSNHEGNFDIPVLIGSINKPFGFISKKEVKKIPIVAKWMDAMNCIFMDRKDRRQSIQAIRQGIEKLKQGHSLVIFPEGTRSKGGPIQTFKSGSFRLGIDAKVPILPVVISGTSTIMEKNNGIIVPGDVTVSILPAWMPSQYEGMDIKDLSKIVEQQIKTEKMTLATRKTKIG